MDSRLKVDSSTSTINIKVVGAMKNNILDIVKNVKLTITLKKIITCKILLIHQGEKEIVITLDLVELDRKKHKWLIGVSIVVVWSGIPEVEVLIADLGVAVMIVEGIHNKVNSEMFIILKTKEISTANHKNVMKGIKEIIIILKAIIWLDSKNDLTSMKADVRTAKDTRNNIASEVPHHQKVGINLVM